MRCARELGVPVVRRSPCKGDGDSPLRALLERREIWQPRDGALPAPHAGDEAPTTRRCARILERPGLDAAPPHTATTASIASCCIRCSGRCCWRCCCSSVFQAVFAWAEAPKDVIEAAADVAGRRCRGSAARRAAAQLLVDGLIAGAGGVLVFLPQILILFFFILLLEESGYLPRAAFLLDRIMGGVGLSGRSFIPLLSSFACAIPGIMATRTIADPRDRLATILIAPMMTCSARLPVYALLIGAFIPQRSVGGLFELQGVVLFALYVAGIVGAMGGRVGA